MPCNSKRKGKRGELEIVTLAKAEGFGGAKRTSPMQAGHAKHYPDVTGVGPLWIESRCYKVTPCNRFAREVLDGDQPKGAIPALVWRDLRTPWRATVRLEDLLRLVRLAYAVREPEAEAGPLAATRSSGS